MNRPSGENAGYPRAAADLSDQPRRLAGGGGSELAPLKNLDVGIPRARHAVGDRAPDGPAADDRYLGVPDFSHDHPIPRAVAVHQRSGHLTGMG